MKRIFFIFLMLNIFLISCGDDPVDDSKSCNPACSTNEVCKDGECIVNCIPKTCDDLARECGAVDDGCGETLNCGMCETGNACDAMGKCVSVCTPKTCDDLVIECGSVDNGCGTTLECGTCEAGKECDATGKCITIACTPNEKRCNADNSAVETCNTAGDEWESVNCVTGEVCNPVSTECEVEITCTPDEKRCNTDNTAIETCNATGDAWESVDCGMGEICNPISTECEVEIITCTPSEKRCNPDNTAIETCNTAGDAWESVDCATSEVCNPTTIVCEVEVITCTPDEKRCNADNTAVETCNTAGDTWEFVDCAVWQECNPSSVTCKTRNGFCASEDDCSETEVCNTNHKCTDSLPAECLNQCLDQDSNLAGTCSIVGGLPTCECDEGFLKSPNSLRCLRTSNECEDEVLACAGHGNCIANNNGTLGCACDSYYIPDATDPMLCVPTVVCSNSNHEGTCEFSCEECLEGEDGVWGCAVPEGERPCYKNFNDQCDPGLGFSNNPGCAGDMFCLGDTAEDGYCSTRTCTDDLGCPTTYGDQFTCKYYGDGFIGICIKGADSCFNADGTRKGGGEEGEPCSDECKEADCNVGNICEKGFCSKKCSGVDDLTCGTNRECIDLSGDAGLFYCLGPVVGVGEDCLDAVCANGLMCLGDQQTWANCFMPCTTVGSEDECVAVGIGSKCKNFGQVGNFCGAPQTQNPGEECDQFSHGCIGDAWCLGTGGDDPSYCFASCTESSDPSDECEGEKCVHFGTAPNDGYYCEIAPSKNVGEECNMANGCVDDGWCLGTGEGNPSYCFASCNAALENSDECDGETCVELGTDFFYCEIAPSKNLGEECDMVNTCLNDALCLSNGGTPSVCYETCIDETSNCTQIDYTCTDSDDIGWICLPSN